MLRQNWQCLSKSHVIPRLSTSGSGADHSPVDLSTGHSLYNTCNSHYFCTENKTFPKWEEARYWRKNFASTPCDIELIKEDYMKNIETKQTKITIKANNLMNVKTTNHRKPCTSKVLAAWLKESKLWNQARCSLIYQKIGKCGIYSCWISF